MTIEKNVTEMLADLVAEFDAADAMYRQLGKNSKNAEEAFENTMRRLDAQSAALERLIQQI